ncbi:MAG: hypothetical protein HFE63_05060 [Clostridiales bacterium]|nr:hypothetical protein [Clostridiales bacterium]
MLKNAKLVRAISLAAALLMVVICASSCALSLKEVDGKLYDKKNDITYIGAPICFEPIALETEVYAKCSKPKLELHAIEGLSPLEWISEPYEGIGGVWYAEGVELPTLETFDADIMYICVEKSITVALGVVEDKSDIDAIISAFTNGEPCSIVNSGSSYKLKFASAKYPGIYYNLLYIEGDDGNQYIYDRTTQTCVNVGDVMLKYLER